MQPEIKAGLAGGLLLTLLGLWPTPVAMLVSLAGVGLIGYLSTRRLAPTQQPAAWPRGLVAGGLAGLVSLGGQLANLLLVVPGGRFPPALWLWPTTLGAWVSMAALRLLLFAAVGALGGWLATQAPRGAAG